jgi:purine-nucleoside phosphorylase
MSYFDEVSEAAQFLRAKLGRLRPHLGIVLGSGLGAAADAVHEPVIVPYEAIPHFPKSTVEGHSGRLVAGMLGGAPVVVMQGRVHFYVGYSLKDITFPMRVMGALGIRAVILTNAAGGIAAQYKIGQLVLIADHINMMGWNPLVGPNEPRFAFDVPNSGLRFCDMSDAYSKRLREVARQITELEGEALEEGVYLASKLPRRFAPFAPWEPLWSACLPCRRPS